MVKKYKLNNGTPYLQKVLFWLTENACKALTRLIACSRNFPIVSAIVYFSPHTLTLSLAPPMHQAHPQTLGLSLNCSILQNVLPPDHCIVGFWQSMSCLNVTFPKRPFPLIFSLQHLPLSVLILVFINDQLITESPCFPTCMSLTQTARNCPSSIVTLHHQDRPINNC